jgi:hypothetical protein
VDRVCCDRAWVVVVLWLQGLSLSLSLLLFLFCLWLLLLLLLLQLFFRLLPWRLRVLLLWCRVCWRPLFLCGLLRLLIHAIVHHNIRQRSQRGARGIRWQGMAIKPKVEGKLVAYLESEVTLLWLLLPWPLLQLWPLLLPLRLFLLLSPP